MPDRSLFTNEGALREATVIKLSIANPAATPTPTVGKMRLFDGTLVPDVTTTEAILIAAETTLTGYPVGGYDVEVINGPQFSQFGGAVITMPLIEVAYASGPAATIGGGWYEDSAGNVRGVFIYDPPRTLAALGDSIQVLNQFLYDRNSLVG